MVNIFKIDKDKETLRDKFAMSVLSEITKEQGQLKHEYWGCENILDANCILAYKIADAMLKARQRK
jgi:hypothetical protein